MNAEKYSPTRQSAAKKIMKTIATGENKEHTIGITAAIQLAENEELQKILNEKTQLSKNPESPPKFEYKKTYTMQEKYALSTYIQFWVPGAHHLIGGPTLTTIAEYLYNKSLNKDEPKTNP